jgi:Papain family cysteine protease
MSTVKKPTAAPENGTTNNRRFDARPDRLDFRDLPYRPPLRSLPPDYPLNADVRKYIATYIAEGLVLNQGNQGACTGFGLACVANYLLWTRHLENKTKTKFAPVSPRMLYELAKRYDEWPGADYDGSSCRGALKAWHKHGVCSATGWPYKLDSDGNPVFIRPRKNWAQDAARRPLGVYYRINRESIVDIQAAIFNIGAVYVSANAHDGWDALSHPGVKSVAPTRQSDLPSILPIKDKKSLGGHAFALVGYNERGFIVQNSWGTSWGAAGFGVLPYDDWVVHGTDAWTCALGVPLSLHKGSSANAQPVISTRWRVGSGRSLTHLGRDSRDADNPANDPWPIDHTFKYKPYQPWSTDTAYQHTLVMGNDGELMATDFTRAAFDKQGLAAELIREAPQQWFAAQKGKVLKCVIYAHGGLDNEEASINRLRVLGPNFMANGIYPIFLTWKTGVGETLYQVVQNSLKRLVGDDVAITRDLLNELGDAKDRALEATAHTLGKGLWTEMCDNAAASTESGHALDLLLQNLMGLHSDLQVKGKTLELHLLGHSAGAVMLGHLVAQLAVSRGPKSSALKIKTSTLFAPACSMAFANRTYALAAKSGVLDLATLSLYVLSDQNEKSDSLPSPSLPAYGKSFLYLVSRALDDVRKMPLLGLERALLTQYANDADQWDENQLSEIKNWQRAWPGTKDQTIFRIISTPEVVTTRAMDHVKATHGSFDNNINVMAEAIARIKGGALVAPLEWLDY